VGIGRGNGKVKNEEKTKWYEFSDLGMSVILVSSRSGVKNSLIKRVETESPKIISFH